MDGLLTIEKLKAMQPGTVFAQGEVENTPQGIFMSDEQPGRKLCWVAKRGGYHDWGIYIHWADRGYGYALTNGDKVINEANIKKLVPCDEEAFKMYRY